ncbi:MAG: hypothetical protein AB8B55_23985 [Mariniblastus sp.]
MTNAFVYISRAGKGRQRSDQRTDVNGSSAIRPHEEFVYADGRNFNKHMQRAKRELESLLGVTPDAISLLNRD